MNIRRLCAQRVSPEVRVLHCGSVSPIPPEGRRTAEGMDQPGVPASAPRAVGLPKHAARGFEYTVEAAELPERKTSEPCRQASAIVIFLKASVGTKVRQKKEECFCRDVVGGPAAHGCRAVGMRGLLFWQASNAASFPVSSLRPTTTSAD